MFSTRRCIDFSPISTSSLDKDRGMVLYHFEGYNIGILYVIPQIILVAKILLPFLKEFKFKFVSPEILQIVDKLHTPYVAS